MDLDLGKGALDALVMRVMKHPENGVFQISKHVGLTITVNIDLVKSSTIT